MATLNVAGSEEAVLVRLLTGERKNISDRLWRYLDCSRRVLRLVCHALNRSITRHVGQLFRNLYVCAPYPNKDIDVVRVVGPLCHQLVITIRHPTGEQIGPGTSPWTSSSIQNRQSTLRSISRRHLWIGLLSSFHQLRVLTLRVYVGNDSSSHSEIDETLVTLRIAVEQNRLRELRTLNLSPVPMPGLLRLCWTGFGAFSQMPKAPIFWKQIETLDLRIWSPCGTNGVDQRDVVVHRKALYHYLRSFSQTLRILRLIWHGHEGPSPLTLHHESGLEGRWPIQWPSVKELWVGNVSLPFQTIRLAKDLAPSLGTLKMLRSTRRESGLVDSSDSSAWIDIELGKEKEWRHSQASSVYSQRSDQSIDQGESVSRSSRSIVVYRDF